MKRIIFSITTVLTLASLFLAPVRTSAQMVNTLYFLEKTPFHTKWNPAMAPSRTGIGVGVSNIGMSVRSDLAYSDIFYPSTDGTGDLWTVLNRNVDKTAFLDGLGDVSNIGISNTLDILNLGLKLGGIYVTVGSSLVTDVGIGLPKDLFKLVLLGAGNNETLDLTDLNINAMSYLKTGAGISVKLGNMFTVGVNANYLMGLANVRLGFDNFSISTSGTSWDIATQGDLRISSPEALTLKYEGTDNSMNGINFDNQYVKNLQNDPFGNLPKAGTGMSFDVGLTFKPLNFLTISAAMMDFGSIKWDPAYIQQAKSTGTFSFSGADLANGGTAGISTEDLQGMMNLKKYNDVEAYTTDLTTKINVGAEAGIANNKLTLGILSQTGLTENGSYQDFMFSANFKPGNLIQTAVSYSLLHGNMSSLGAAVNLKLLFLNLFVAADYVPLKITPQGIPINNSYFNLQTGFNFMF
jgi:hypothetical protein